MFTFSDFLLVNSGVLSVYDGLTTDASTKIDDFSFSNPIGDDVWNQVNNRKCSPQIFSSGRALTFVFNANGSSTGDSRAGWIADIEIFPSSYSQSKIDELSGQTLIYEGYFFDDGDFDGRYSTDDYTVTFQAPSDYILKLNFLSYDITGNNDKLDIYDGANTSSTRLARLQGNSDPISYYSNGEYLTIDWTARSTNPTIRGWVAKIEAVSLSCGIYTLDATLNGTTTYTDCGTFFDSGEGDNDYSVSDDYSATFCSSNGLPLTFNFYDYDFRNSTMSIYDGATTSTTQLNFNTGQFFNSGDLNDKYITSSGTCLTFDFDASAPPDAGWAAKILTQPHISNDDMCDATSLSVNSARIMDNYNNLYATENYSVSSSCQNTNFIKDVWFYFIIPDDELFTVDVEISDIRSLGAALYSGSCSGILTEENCSNADEISFTQSDVTSPTAGDTIFVRIWGRDGEAGTFSLGVYSPVSTYCADANYYTIEKQSTLSYVDLTGAGDSGFSPAPSCGNYTRSSPFGEVWYKFNVPESQELLFKTQKGDLDDINFAVYEGSGCGGLTEVFCYADAETNDYFFDASAHAIGDTLWLVYWGDKYNNNIGDFQFSIHDPEPESNDPCDAILVNVSGEEDFDFYDNTGADDSGHSNPGCSWSTDDKDMWFKFVAPKDGKATVKTTGGSLVDIGLAVYSGNCSGLSLIQCTNSNGLGEIELNLTNLTPDDSIFVRTWGTAAAYGIYGLSISVENPDGSCDANLLTVQDYSEIGDYTFQGYSTSENTASGIDVALCGSPSITDIDIWFNAIIPSSGQIAVITQNESLPTIGMALYNGTDCSNPSYIDCTNGDGNLNIELSGQTPGDTLRIRIWSDYAQTGYFEIAAYDIATSVEIIGLNANYCYSETSANYNIVGSPLSGIFTYSSDLDFTDNGDGTGILYIGGDNTKWGNFLIEYTVNGTTVSESFSVAPSYVPSVNSDTISICDNGSTAGFIASGETSAVFNWYSDASLSTLIHTGSVYTPLTITWIGSTAYDTYTYYVTQQIDVCTSDAYPVTYKIYKIPETGNTIRVSNTLRY